jgi:hypothetical protein
LLGDSDFKRVCVRMQQTNNQCSIQCENIECEDVESEENECISCTQRLEPRLDIELNLNLGLGINHLGIRL